MALATTVATGTTDALTGITTLDPRPANSFGIVELDANGNFRPVPEAALGVNGGPGAATVIAETIGLNGLQDKLSNGSIAANVQYACSSDLWNNGDGGTVWVLGLKTDAYWPVGIGTVNGTRQFVTIDVAAATYVPFAAGAAGTPRDIYDVPTAKRKEVVDANVPAYAETDSSYYGKVFVDEDYGPGQPAKYECLPSAPATTGGATVWKWFRIDIL
jgi:hypothetical protein